MGSELIWTCDACRKRIGQEEIEKSNLAFNEFAQDKSAHVNILRQSNPEVFCSEHVVRAVEYWDSKVIALANCVREMTGRMAKHANRFWGNKPVLTVVK